MSGARSLPVVQLLTGLALLAWPLLIGFGLAHNGLRWLLPLMALLFLLRLIRRQTGPLYAAGKAVAAAGVTLCVASYLLDTHQLLLFYPAVVNGVMLAIFGGSLWSAMPIVERLARLREPDLSATGVRYTRRVTQVWCVFFIFNGSTALFTALYGNITLWTVWNGTIAYLLIATLMTGEWLIRRRIIKRETRCRP